MNEAEIRWRALCAAEAEMRQELFELWLAKEQDQTFPQNQLSPNGAFRNKVREWWAEVENLLKFASVGGGRIVPSDLLAALSGLAGHLAVGDIPSPILLAAIEGRRPMVPRERSDIGLAVAYIRAARGGIEHYGKVIEIDDKKPIKTIQDAFGVPRQSVQRWLKNADPCGLGENPVDAEILESLMRQAGGRYQTAGRSRTALNARDRRRHGNPHS